jgi:hypothetical protein
MTELSNEDAREMRHGIRDLQKSMAALQAFRIGDETRMTDKFTRIDARLKHIEDRVESMSSQMSRWKGMGFVIILIGGGLGSVATWFFGK